MALKNVTGIDITYDNKVAGNLIDPYEWNNNFQKIETNINENIKNLNENFTLLAGEDGAAEIGIEDYVGSTEVASTVCAQILLIASKIVNMYSKTQIDSMINAGKSNTVSSISYNSDNGTFTITKADGTTSSIDTNIEKIPVSVELEEDETSGKVYLKITNYDGSSSKADVTSLLNVYTVSDTTTIDMTLLEGEISAAIKKGSITSDHLSSGVIETFEAYKTACSSYAVSAQGSATSASASASASAKNASDADKDAKAAAASANSASDSATSAASAASAAGLSKDAAEDSAKESESWAVGGTGTRTGEDTNNAKYWAEQSKSAASGEYVPISGGTMTGELILSGSPVSANGAATKEYVDTASSNKANINSPTFTGSPKAPTPTSTSDGTQIATKEYVDPVILVVNQQYTEEELDEIFSLHKRVLIQLSGLKLPVLTFSKATSQYIFYCFLNPTTNYQIDYDFTGNHWFPYPTTLAPTVSPTFSGAPKAPTPTNDSIGTQVATKEYVDTASSNKANIDSPVFTGKPKAPTPTPISAGNQIATKEYVDPVILDTTKTYTYAYFKSLADANRNVIIDGHKISRVWTSDIQACFYYMDGPTYTGNYTYLYMTNEWEYHDTPMATKDYVVTRFNNFVPTKIKNQNNVGISIWTGTQTEYEALTTKDASTLYLVKSS